MLGVRNENAESVPTICNRQERLHLRAVLVSDALYTQYQPATPQECMPASWWRIIRAFRLERSQLARSAK
jgi:hypothetical protein